MFKSLQGRLTGFILRFQETGAGMAAELFQASGLKRVSGWIVARWSKSPARLLMELLVAFALTVNFYYLMKPQAWPKADGNMYSSYLFIYLSPLLHMSSDQVPPCWRTRLLAPAVSAWCFGVKFKDATNLNDWDKLQEVFGFYHAGWLFLLFVALSWYRKDALLIMLGVFSGLMYNLILPAGAYYYPWDLPAMFFFTLACLLYDRRQFWPLLVTVWLGSLFKETILCCTLLILLGESWTWKRRIAGLGATLFASFAANKLLVLHYGVKSQLLLPMNDATHFTDLITRTKLLSNVRLLFSLHPNHVLFVGAGVFCVILLIPWRTRRDVTLKLLLLLFVIGQFLYGIIDEFRIWYEALPLGWMLLSETLGTQFPGLPAGAASGTKSSPESEPVEPDRTDRLRQGSYWLILGAVGVTALAFFIIAKNLSPR